MLLDVAPGQGTFRVTTGAGELSVLGTRFLVEAAGEVTTTSVLRGVVALRSGGQEAVLHAGEQGVMQKGVRPTRGPAPRLSHLVSWVAERRKRDERPAAGPMRSGALVARNPQWQDQEFPLPMAALTIDVHLENQVARVALDQTFHNPQDQTLEGVYKFALPPGAAVSRLAMYAVNPKDCFAYGDDISDIPFLGTVKNSFLVMQLNSKLEAIADAIGYQKLYI